MSQILNKVRDVDPNNNDAVKEVLATFFQNLTKHTNVDSNRWLRALETIINRFPKFCGTHRNTIETYLTYFLDSTNYFDVIEAAKCAHALQQVRPSHEKAATPKACWREHLVVLTNAAHNLISSMFPNSVDMYKNSGNVQKLRLQSSATSPMYMALDQINSVPTQKTNMNKQTLYSTRLRNVFVFLQATLVEIYPVPKPIQPQAILEVIVRALSITNVKSNQDIATIVSVKTQALRTLDALVACLGPNLIPFSALIFKFVLQTLKWCSENVNEESSAVRVCAYATLRRWLRAGAALRAGARGGWELELARHVVADVAPHKRAVQLTMSSHPTKHLSKKAKRKLANTMLQESTIASYSSSEKNKVPVSEQANDDIALAALDCAETFLHVCGVFLKPATHKLFQESLVRECYNLDSYSNERALALVRLLEALRKTTPASVPPPTQHCLQLYSVLINSRIDEISKFSSQALLDIRLHLHCSPPSLNFAVEAPIAQKPDKPKKMSARNRAALESLLGAEKLPSETAGEVITVLDEPSTKKPRLDDVVEITDKISVSSESASSVEISDDDSDVLEVEADIEDEETADKSVARTVSSENTADASENTTDTTQKPVNTKVIANVHHQPINVAHETEEETTQEPVEKTIELTKVHDQPIIVVHETEEDSQETTTQATSEEVKTNDEESRDTAAGTESTEKTEESVSQGDMTAAPTRYIHSAATQMPSSASTDSSEEHISSHSMEVTYDLTGTSKDKVNILEKPEDDNLSCTNDTDDIAITCGQVVKNSQDEEKNNEVENKENEEPKVNGDNSSQIMANILTGKTTGTKDVTVEDMLADFVDEVEEEKTEV